MKWAFQIEKTKLDQRNLVELLGSVGFQEVESFESELVFSSRRLDECKNSGEVWEEAKRLRELITEITEIDPEFILGPVLEFTSEGPKRFIFVEAKSGVIVTAGCKAKLTVSPSKDLSEEELIEWHKRRAEQKYQSKLKAQRAKLVPSFREPRAANLLKLLKLESHTGESLYKIYELAEGHPSYRKKFQKEFGISNSEFRRFVDVVHNPIVSGELARHAYEDKPKTDNPMTFSEAESFVKDIAKRWLASLCE